MYPRTTTSGDIGLGSARLVSLAEVREAARGHRQTARDGGDPLADRRKAKLVVPTFKDAAKSVYAEHVKAWKNEKHGDQWINTLKTYVFPHMGDRLVDQIDTPEVLTVLCRSG